MQRYVKAVVRKAHLFFQIGSTQGYKVATRLAVLSMHRRLRALTKNGPENSSDKLPELDALRQSLGQCQDSIRQLTALLAAAGTKPPEGTGLKISVIMPVYNRADIIPAAIRSVLTQEGADFELIVVDDGSTDGLNGAAIPELEAGLVRLLRLPHQGVCAARNQGIAASSGDVIVYLDSDNRMYPGYLRAVAAAYALSPQAACGYAAMLWDDGHDTVHLRHDEFSWDGLLAQRVNIDLNCFSHRRTVWETLGGFDENLTKHSDYDLALRYVREHQPMRIPATAAWYYAGNAFSRISLDEVSEPNIAYIHAKYKNISGRKPRVLISCYDYPQLSESYVHTEIAFLLRQGYEIEVCSHAAPGSPGIAQVPVQLGDLQRAIEEFQPDLIHAHWLSIGAETAHIAQRAGLPVTVRSHGFEFTPENFKRCAAQEAVKSIYLFPHFVAGMQTKHPKVHAMTAAVNTTRFYPRPRRNPKMVLRAGACLATKDIELFFEIAARCPEFTFVLALARIAKQPDLPGKFHALNTSLGNPVDLRFDVPYEEMTEIVAEAGIYLHTSGCKDAFGMPVSIAESLACGALVLVRDCPEARQYAGPHSLYYKNPSDAVDHIRATLSWNEAGWQEQARKSANFARLRYADDKVLATILEDWREITQGPATTPGP